MTGSLNMGKILNAFWDVKLLTENSVSPTLEVWNGEGTEGRSNFRKNCIAWNWEVGGGIGLLWVPRH